MVTELGNSNLAKVSNTCYKGTCSIQLHQTRQSPTIHPMCWSASLSKQEFPDASDRGETLKGSQWIKKSGETGVSFPCIFEKGSFLHIYVGYKASGKPSASSQRLTVNLTPLVDHFLHAEAQDQTLMKTVEVSAHLLCKESTLTVSPRVAYTHLKMPPLLAATLERIREESSREELERGGLEEEAPATYNDMTRRRDEALRNRLRNMFTNLRRSLTREGSLSEQCTIS